MTTKSDEATPGRPPTPMKTERLAIATYLANEGMSFCGAARQGVQFWKYDFNAGGYVPDDEINDQLPKSPERRRVALYEYRREVLEESEIVPLAFRFHAVPKKGRPKKKR